MVKVVFVFYLLEQKSFAHWCHKSWNVANRGIAPKEDDTVRKSQQILDTWLLNQNKHLCILGWHSSVNYLGMTPNSEATLLHCMAYQGSLLLYHLAPSMMVDWNHSPLQIYWPGDCLLS